MNVEQSWLPDDCLASPISATATVRTIGSWSRDWISLGVWKANAAFTRGCQAHVPSVCASGAFEIRADADSVLSLGLSILGQPERKHLTERDGRTIKRLARTALNDLVTKIEALVPLATRNSPFSLEKDDWHLSIKSGSREFVLCLDREALISLARVCFVPRSDSRPLVRAADAVLDVTVTISGVLGTIPLLVEQIVDLEVGDMLLVETAPESLVELLIDENKAAFGFGLTQIDDSLAFVRRN